MSTTEWAGHFLTAQIAAALEDVRAKAARALALATGGGAGDFVARITFLKIAPGP
jgi:hypothetical protein